MMVSTIINYSWIIFQVIVGYNLLLPAFFYLCYRFKKSGNEAAPAVDQQLLPDYAIIVTAYQQTALVKNAVNSLLKMNYRNYLIYVVADDCDITDLNFDNEQVIVLKPEVELKSNVKSHFYAIRNFAREHSHLTIIDSDNVVDRNYLDELNKTFARGYLAVQGVRLAKNSNTTYARLDAARDIYYHFYDGELLFGLGSSATLAGSGMAFTTKLYRRCLDNHFNLYGAGFDKVLQYEIVNADVQIAYQKTAIVYDEKTAHSTQLVSQRARWINTWFKYFGYGFKLMNLSLRERSKNQFLFGLVLLRPPLFIFLILSALCLIANLFITPVVTLIWLAGFLLFIGGFLIALANSNTSQEVYRSLIDIPKFIFFQLQSLLRSGSANERSVATQHLDPNRTT